MTPIDRGRCRSRSLSQPLSASFSRFGFSILIQSLEPCRHRHLALRRASSSSPQPPDEVKVIATNKLAAINIICAIERPRRLQYECKYGTVELAFTARICL